MKRKLSFLLCIAISSFILAPSHAAQRTQTVNYYSGTDLAPTCRITELPTELRDDPSIGGGCFELQGDETSVAFSIDDLSGLAVGGAYEFVTAGGSAIGAATFFCDSATATIPSGAASLAVYAGGAFVGPAACFLLGQTGVPATTGTITATFELGGTGGVSVVDSDRDCLEPVPAAANLKGITDDGSDVELSVRVLLDGIPLAVGQSVFEKAARSYAPLGVNLVVTGFEEVTLLEADGYGLINQAKDRFGGSRPAGSDLVYVLTNKDIQVFGLEDIAGLADCVGGIRYPERAFAIGEIIGYENLSFQQLHLFTDATAKVAAHEIGHLMGGQHHLANCVEGDGRVEPEYIDAAPCSLMFNSIELMSSKFDTLNGAVVRGHAVKFASP